MLPTLPPWLYGKGPRIGQAAVAQLPTVLLFTSVAWTGTFQAPIWPEWVLAGHLMLYLFVMVMAGSWRQSLAALGWGGIPVTLLTVWLVMGVAGSPVPRAGWLALSLWPIFLLLPSAVANCWRQDWQRRQGLQGIGVLLAAIGVISLGEWLLGHSDRVALPLGHHNLLALWLVTLLPVVMPLAAVGVKTPQAWGRPAILVISLPAMAALLATGSLSGLLGALACLACAWWLRRRRPGSSSLSSSSGWSWRRVVLGTFLAGLLILVIGGLQGERLHRLVSGSDSSWEARSAYWQGAWQGSLERPWGWGAGAIPWTLARFLPVRPGVLPPGEVVADTHSLPLGLLYELGWPGACLVAWLLLALWRRMSRDGSEACRRHPVALSLVAFSVTALAGAPLSVLALPTAWAVAVGSGLTPTPTSRARQRWSVGLPILLLLVITLRLDLAAIHYSRAIDGLTLKDQRRALVQAIALDPRFPLYSVQLALLDDYAATESPSLQVPGTDSPQVPGTDSPQVPGTQFSALQVLAPQVPGTGFLEDSSSLPQVPGTESPQVPGTYWAAAEGAHSIAPLWLLAGRSGQAADLKWSQRALERACDLDPLSFQAPFLLATGEPVQARSVPWAARSLMAEPNLLAATAWRQRREVLDAAVELLVDHPAIDAGWRLHLMESHRRIVEGYGVPPTSVQPLILGMDGDASSSLSLYAFRRRPWPADLVVIEVDAAAIERLDLASLSTWRETEAGLFASGCSLGLVP